MSEPDAFRWIQKTSMDQRLAMRTVAERILEGAMTPGAAAGDAASSAAGTETAGGAKPGSGA
jgi:hypothetical protein